MSNALRQRPAAMDIHDLEPEEFLEEVHSFEFWFQAVEGYLTGLTWGHRPDTAEAALSALERDRLITVLCNYCVGETAALEGASGLIAFAPNRLAKVFLATQVADEGRHLEVLQHRLRDLGVAQPELEIERRASRSLQLFRRRLLELVASRDWEAAIFAQNVILEALEFAVFHSHAQTADPITREVLQGIIKDERRHIGFGENELGRRLATAPHIRARLGRVKTELDHLVLDALEETMLSIAALPDERNRLGRAYLESVERLGFAP
ncbi:MAG TPA: ferritin-like domain-containing protein [Candidatus Dormibacteraeota bacterium]|nr:ferritin-like domain-containing protein [Candidatus Dormibacteraeota bacterium]